MAGTIALIKFSDKAGAIRKMYVKEEFRGKKLGIAQQLLETLINYSRQNGLTDIYLGSLNILKASLRFYERNHFTYLKEENLPADFPLMADNNLFLHLKLDTSDES